MSLLVLLGLRGAWHTVEHGKFLNDCAREWRSGVEDPVSEECR